MKEHTEVDDELLKNQKQQDQQQQKNLLDSSEQNLEINTNIKIEKEDEKEQEKTGIKNLEKNRGILISQILKSGERMPATRSSKEIKSKYQVPQGFTEALTRITALDDSSEAFKKRSDDFKNLYYACKKILGLGPIDGKDLTPELARDIMRLSETSFHYLEKKMDSSKQDEKSVSDEIISYLGRIKNVEVVEEAYFIHTDDEIKTAIDNVDKVAKNYITLSQAIGDNMMLSDYEKAAQRYNALKVWEDDIKVILNGARLESIRKRNFNVYWACISYRRNKMVLNLADQEKENKHVSIEDTGLSDHVTKMAKKEAGVSDKKLKKSHEPDNLPAEKLAGIKEIDSWIIRNFHKGGWFSRHHTERADLVDQLLSKSPRERLCIYYMIEKRARINPSMAAVANSQTSYVPNLSNFKDKMLAGWYRLYKRAKGGYIYWNKLREAMAITENAYPFIEAVRVGMQKESDDSWELDLEEEKDNKNILLTTEDQIKHAQKKATVNIQKVINEIVKVSKKADNKDDIKALLKESELTGLMTDAMNSIKTYTELKADNPDEEIVPDKMAELSDELQKGKGSRVRKRDKLSEFGSDVSATGGNTASLIRAFEAITTQFGMNWTESGTLTWGLESVGAVSVEFLGSILGIAYGILGMVKQGGQYTAGEWFNAAAGILSSIGWGMQKAVSLLQVAGVVTKEAGTFGGSVLGSTYLNSMFGAGTALSLYNLGRDANRFRHRDNATDLLIKKHNGTYIEDPNKQKMRNDQRKFDEGLLKLHDTMNKKFIVGDYTSVITSTTVLCVSLLGLSCLGLVGAAGFAVGIGVNIWNTKNVEREKRLGLFDSFFKVDSIFDAEKNALLRNRSHQRGVSDADFEARNPKMLSKLTLSASEEKRLRENIRSKIAASLGFSSVKDASGFVATKYGEYLIGLLHSTDVNDQEMAKEYIKGLGLPIKIVADPAVDPVAAKKNKPKVSDIAGKLS